MTKAELLVALCKLVVNDKSTFVRRISHRFKVHSVAAKGGGLLYFVYDRNKNSVTRILSEKEATFSVGETVLVYSEHAKRYYKATIVHILQKGLTPRDVIDMFPNKDHKIFSIYRHHKEPSYILQYKDNLYWYGIRHMRKMHEAQ